MFWVIVLAKCFIKEFVFSLFIFCGVAMCFDPVEKGPDAAYFVLTGVVAVIVQDLVCVGLLPVYFRFYCAVFCPC